MAVELLRRVIAMGERTQGFTLDGKPLLALVTVEKAGKEYLVTLSSSNLAKAEGGEYFLTLCGEEAETLRFATGCGMRAGEGLRAEKGLCALLWLEREGRVTEIAQGSSGRVLRGPERLRAEALRVAKSPVYGKESTPTINQKIRAEQPLGEGYEDDAIATENYFEKEKNKHEERKAAPWENAVFTGQDFPPGQAQGNGVCPTENEDDFSYRRKGERGKITDAEHGGKTAEGRPPFTADEGKMAKASPPFTEGGGEIADLWGGEGASHPFPFPEGETFFERKKGAFLRAAEVAEEELPLMKAVPGGYFIRTRDQKNRPVILGVVTFRESIEREGLSSLKTEEIVTLCYALPKRGDPPREIEEYCHFLPVKTKEGARGYYLICQNPVTGNPERTDLS